MKTLKTLLRSGLFVAAFLTFAGIAHATDFTVNTLDFGADDNTCDVTKCTINEAIAAAKADPGPGPNRIIFDPAISGGTINVTSHLDLDGAFPELTIFANNDITLAATSGGFDNYTLYIAPTTSNVTVDGLNFNEGGQFFTGNAGVGAVKIGGGDVTVTLQNNKFIRNSCSTDNHTIDISLNSIDPDIETIISNNTSDFTSLFFYTETAGAFNTITNNELTNGCIASMIYLKAGAGTIRGNTIYSSADDEASHGIIAYDNDFFGVTGPSEWGTVNIDNNELYSTDTNTDDGAAQFTGISITDYNRRLTFNITNNTILPADSNKYLDFGISVESGDDITITGNKIAMKNGVGGIIFNLGDTTSNISNVLVEHNTVYGSNAGPEGAIGITNSPGTGLTLTNATIKNNIFANTVTGIVAGWDDDPNGMPVFVNFVNDYNIYYQTPTEERDCASMAIRGSEALGEHSLSTVDPAFTDPDNYDFTLLPYSYAIGFADDGSDAGAEDYDGVRARTTIYVDDDGVIDHETEGAIVDYNDIQSAIYAAAPAGDTILVAAGTYTETPDLYGKALTLTGESAENTIIDADEEDVAMTMSSDSVVSNFTIQNTRASTNYEVELHTYDYDGNTYDDGTEGGVPTMLFAVAKSTPADAENDFDFIAEEGDTASNIGENLHLGLVSGSGMYFTMYFRDSLYPDQATAQAYLDELEMGLTIDKWFADTFTYSGGVFTFTDPEIADPTVVLTVGYNEPAITNAVPEPQGGLYFENTSGTSVSDVNIDTHGIGIYFTGDSLTNTVLNVIFSNISICDTFSDATGTNSVNGEDVVEELCLVIPDPEDPEEPDPDITSPVGLTALTLGSRTSSSVTLNWSQVVEANFSHYEIWYGTNATDVANRNGSAAEWDIDNAANLSTISTTSTTITGLSSSTQYYFKIWAVDASNNQETVASLSVTTSSNGGGGGGGVVTTPNKPEVEEIVINGPPTNPAITDITETIIDTTETVKDTIIKENEDKKAQEEKEKNEREAVEQVSDIIAEILTTDLVDKIVDLDADIEPTEEDTSSPYTPEDLAVLTDPNEDIDGDGISNADEIARGTDPLVNNTGTIDKLFTQPLEGKEINSNVGALKVLGVGDEGFVVSGSTTPESKVEITITNSKGYKVTLKTTADINGNYILPVTVTDQLIDGSLLIKATNEEGKKDVVLAKFKESTLQKPTLTFEGEKVIRYEDLTLRELIALIEASNEYKNVWAQGSNVYQLSSLLGTSIEKKIAFTLERADFKTIEGGKIIVKGKATPGSTVVLAYKSVIYSSVVIADKNGNFTAELPRDLQEELAKDPNATDALHEFIVFAMDYKKNETSAFNRGQFRLFK